MNSSSLLQPSFRNDRNTPPSRNTPQSKPSKRFLVYDSLNKTKNDFSSDSLSHFGIKNEPIRLCEPHLPPIRDYKKDSQVEKYLKSHFESMLNIIVPKTPPGSPMLR